MKLSIIDNTKDLVLVGIDFSQGTDLTVPDGFTGEETTARITKGKERIMSVYNGDTIAYSFKFTENSNTFITAPLENVKWTIIRFISSERIQLLNRNAFKETAGKIVYPLENTDRKIALHIGGEELTFVQDTKDIKAVLGNYTVMNVEKSLVGNTYEEVSLI